LKHSQPESENIPETLENKGLFMTDPLKITALQPETLVRLLKQAGSRLVSLEALRADFETGAPRNPDGTVNLIEYAAWLAKESEDNGN